MIITGAKNVEEIVTPGEHVLYHGEVIVRFDESLHRYTVLDRAVSNDFVVVPSVTTVLSAMLDKSKMLVPWATRLARESVIASIQPNTQYIAEHIQRIAYESSNVHKRVLAEAGRIGTEVHKAIETFLRMRAGETVQMQFPADAKAAKCFMAAAQWIALNNVQMIAAEKILYSRKHRVIGTTDLAAQLLVGGRSAIADWKSSNRLLRTYELQLAAYRSMMFEQTGFLADDRILIRLDKEDGSFHPQVLSTETADAEAEAFFQLAKSYRQLNELKFFEET